MYKLTAEGKKYLEKGLPEKRLVKLVGKKLSIKDAKSMEDFAIAIQWAKKKNWISVARGEIEVLEDFEKIEADRTIEDGLKDISKGKIPEKSILKVLLERKLIEKEREDIWKKAEKFVGKKITDVDPSLIMTGLWRKVKFKPYNTEVVGKRIYPGKKHVISFYIEKIRRIFLDLGFEEREGPLVESSFWNFDALYQPQDHPARDMADTFYMKNPSVCHIPKCFERVKKTHENGWTTGSDGWGYKWKKDIAEQPILRTHTTAVSARALTTIKPPAKIFCIGRVFRNETIDYKHLPEFTQIEGIVVDKSVNFRNLLGLLKEFYKRMGFEKIRFRPAYFPYTEMSVEPEVYFAERREWIELGGAGIFRPEVTKPLGINVPVLAWGLGLERLIMLNLGIDDIRNFYYRNDIKFLREVCLWRW